MLVTPASSVNTSAGVKRRRETQSTHEEKVREQDLLPWKFRRGNWGNPSAPVDVINAAAHVFERKWAKRESDLNRFLAMCSCLPQWFDAMSDVVPSLKGWRQRIEVSSQHGASRGQEQELADELSESLEWHTGTMKVPSKGAWAMALDKH